MVEWLWRNQCDKTSEGPFAISKYKDKVICDVVLMHAGHVLFGRPWQFDRKVVHNGFTNRCSFVMNGKPITLILLSPKQVHEDQMCLKQKNKEIINEGLRI